MSVDAGPVVRARSWVAGSDARLLLAVTGGLYLLFTVASVLLGFDLNGIARTLRRITFLSAVYAMLTLALNVQWGYAGLFNLGIAGFMAIGVYAMGMLTLPADAVTPGLGLPLPVGVVGGVLAAAGVGAVASLPALRLKGDYLAIVTVAFSEMIRLTVKSSTAQKFEVAGVTLGTGGAQGMNLPTNPVRVLFYENPELLASDPSGLGAFLFESLGSFGIRQSVVVAWAYTLVLVAFVGLFYWLLVRVGNSPFGRVLKAIREDQTVANALGKDTRGFKIKTFALGCGLMGLVAILWRFSGGYASPGLFRPIQTFYIFVALIIGGAGSNTGSVVGGAVFASLLFEGPAFFRRVVKSFVDLGSAPETLFQGVAALGRADPTPVLAYTLSDVNISALRLVLLGVVLVYLIQNRPEGLLGHRQETAASVDLAEREGNS
jgi:branched-chain amino acid transport system permease protein